MSKAGLVTRTSVSHRLENLELDTKRDLEFGSEKVVLVYNWDHSTPETV